VVSATARAVHDWLATPATIFSVAWNVLPVGGRAIRPHVWLMTTQTTPPPACTVLYDGSCPLCTQEIGFYQRAKGANALEFVDVSRTDGQIAEGLSRDQAMARFHVIDGNGNLVSGGRAFATLWLTLPGWRWAGRLFSRGAGGWLIDRAYDLFLPVRPLLQRLARRRQRP
jgi:predicted DCC family thiol-disulfide oxidoreductase YuxK